MEMVTLSPQRNSLYLSFALCCLVSSIAQAEGKWGRIELPARGVLSLEEATVECWVKFNFDPKTPATGRWNSRGVWFTFQIPKGAGLPGSLITFGAGLKDTSRHRRKSSACLFRVGFMIDGEELPHPIFFDATKWGKGKWHHMAVAWTNARRVSIYVDGKLIHQRQYPIPFRKTVPRTARIVLGQTGYVGNNSLVIDEVRISSIARRAEELGFFRVPLNPDPYTMLLENFDNVTTAAGKTLTVPTTIALVGGPRSFEVVGGKIVPGKVANGFAFDPRAQQQ